MSKTQGVNRYDNIDRSEWMTRPFERTKEGFIRGRAIVTCCGVFTYARSDGTVTRELRLPEEVFSAETLESLKLKPVTLGHPGELVTPDNAQDLQVGSLGDNPTYSPMMSASAVTGAIPYEYGDGINVAIDMIVTEKDAIEAILNGKQGLSMGYTCDVEEAEPGSNWCGVDYDYIQRNIRYNHCAIVDKGRAGDNARINLRIDSQDAILQAVIKADGGIRMKKLNLDGIEYEAEETVIKAFNSEKKRADEATAELEALKKDSAEKISKLEAERDTQKERADKLDDENKSLKENYLDKSKLDEAVKGRIELLRNAEKAGVEVKGDESDIDLKKQIIAKVFPKANLDGKDDVYIEARYDASIETLADNADAQARQVLNDNDNADHMDSVDEARQKMIARLTNKED